MRYMDSPSVSCEERFENGKQTFTFTGPCPMTGKIQSVTVDGADLHKLRQGAHIQSAFPYLSASEREFLISGYSDEAWEMLFGEDEDYADDND